MGGLFSPKHTRRTAIWSQKSDGYLNVSSLIHMGKELPEDKPAGEGPDRACALPEGHIGRIMYAEVNSANAHCADERASNNEYICFLSWRMLEAGTGVVTIFKSSHSCTSRICRAFARKPTSPRSSSRARCGKGYRGTLELSPRFEGRPCPDPSIL